MEHSAVQPEMNRTERPTAEPTKKRNFPVVAAVLFGLLAAAYLGLCAYAMRSDKIFPNTYLAGTDINLGGKTMEEAAALLEAQAFALNGATLHLTWEEKGAACDISYEDLGFSYGAGQSADALYAAGREHSITTGAKYLQHLLFSGGVEPVAIASGVEVDRQTLEQAAGRVAQQLGTLEAVDYAAAVDGAELLITKSRDGLAIDEAKLSEALYAFLTGAELSTAQFTVDETLCTVLPAKEGDLAALCDSLVGEVVNAAYDHETGGITQSRAGADFTLEELTAAYEAAEPGETFRFNANISEPEVTTAELEQCLFRDELSSYTTRVSGAAGRRENVRLTAARINGYIMNPGETMRYGDLTAPFTEANGYFPAPGYIKGKTVDMMGGGACQASSTLYAATLYANLEIVQRINHGFASDYIGLGLDATVAEGGPEFEFRNNTRYPIKVVTEYFAQGGNNYLKVSILGTKVDDSYVKITSEVLSTTPWVEEYVETDELAPGETLVDQTPYTGYDVRTYRNVYSGDGTLISSTFEARSRYNVRNRVILVGKAAESAGSTPGAEPAQPLDPTQPIITPAEEAAETVSPFPDPLVGSEPQPLLPYVPPM